MLYFNVPSVPEAYEVLRDEAPVWQDPLTGFFVVSRYDDVRAVIFDTENFVNGARSRGRVGTPEMLARQAKIAEALERLKGAL